MKIAILTCGILPIPAVQGGAVENLIDFYMEYNDRKKLHEITVYSPWDAKANKHPALTSDVNHYIYINVTSFKAKIERRIYKYFHSKEYYNYFIEYYFERVYADLKRRYFDFVILENCPGYAIKLSQRGYQNMILHLHNDLLNSTTQYHDKIYNSVVKILTVSDYIKGRVSTIYKSDKILTVHNGIDLKKFSPREPNPINREDIGFSNEDFVLVYSGRVNKDKGVSELIDAMIQLRDTPQIKLMILGGAFFDNTQNEDEFIRSLKYKTKCIENKIIFTGFIPYDQVPNYLQLGDIAVLPSMWQEPFGLTIVEAMAIGLPLITTRSGGIPEICEGVATIIERKHIINNLTDAILDLYQNSGKRKQMSSSSIERAKLYNKETFSVNFFNAINKISDANN